MRIALLSDIHGCPIALEAVLADLQAHGGADVCWVLGDLVDRGYDPHNVLERLTTLPNAFFTYGNTDSYVLNRLRPPYPTLDHATENPALLPRVLQIETGIAWIQGALDQQGWLGWLGQHLLELRYTLPNGKRLLGVHAAPGQEEGIGIRPYMSDDEIYALVKDAEADIVIVGHTHVPVQRRIQGIEVVNLGCIGMPVKPDLRAGYGILEADEHGYEITLRRVDYDHQAVIAALEASSNPAKAYMLQFYQGLCPPIWER